MMLLKLTSMKVCRLCGKEKQQGTHVFEDKSKGSVLISIINKYLSKEVINISITDEFSKYVCIDCEQKICRFDEFCLMVANIQKQLSAPALEIDFAEDMLCHLKQSDLNEKSAQEQLDLNLQKKRKCICIVCGKGFRCQAHLERHKRIHTGQRPFVCNICQMSFNQQEILTKHKECHEGKKQFQCANCHQSFRYKVSLKSHMINFHTAVDQSMIPNQMPCMQQQSLVCSECGKMFATRYKLARHARIHTGERPYHCNFCDRSFSQTGNLKLHQLKCHQIPCPMLDPQQQDQSQRIDSGASVSLNSFQPMYIFDSEIQKTINETINSTDAGSSYLSKSYENSIYIDDDIETMLDHDINQLERQKYATSSHEGLTSHEKISLCLKQPETPELLHSLLYDD